MNTANESVSPEPNHPHLNGLWRLVKKVFMVLLALTGIGLILWLDSWFMDHGSWRHAGTRS